MVGLNFASEVEGDRFARAVDSKVEERTEQRERRMSES